MKEFVSKSLSDTENLAKNMAAQLQGGQLLALVGNLGVGKTVMVKALARAWGVTQNIMSPTFVLLKIYDIDHKSIKKMVHVDCYRLAGQEDLADIGLADYLHQPDTVVVIEWADKISGLPADTIYVNIEHRGEEQRKITVTGGDL